MAVAENESFIEEVTEEVRRDKLYLFLRRYGWIGILLIVGIVLGSIVNEIRSSARLSEAQSFGDKLATSLENIDEVSLAYNTEVDNPFKTHPVLANLLRARIAESNNRRSQAVEFLNKIIIEESDPKNIKDYSRYKILMLTEDNARKTRLLSELIAPDNAFNLLALEQKVLENVRASNWDEASANLKLILSDPKSSQMLKFRTDQLLKALQANGSIRDE